MRRDWVLLTVTVGLLLAAVAGAMLLAEWLLSLAAFAGLALVGA